MPEDTEETGDDPGRLRRMYEESAQSAAQATARVAELERREAFRDAGLDLSNPLHKVVAEAYSGELNAEMVKEHVTQLGLNAPPAAPPHPEVPQDERAALERIERAAAGDGQPATEPDRVEELKRELAEAGRKNNIQELDRISIELARATGNRIRYQ